MVALSVRHDHDTKPRAAHFHSGVDPSALKSALMAAVQPSRWFDRVMIKRVATIAPIAVKNRPGSKESERAVKTTRHGLFARRRKVSVDSEVDVEAEPYNHLVSFKILAWRNQGARDAIRWCGTFSMLRSKSVG